MCLVQSNIKNQETKYSNLHSVSRLGVIIHNIWLPLVLSIFHGKESYRIQVFMLLRNSSKFFALSVFLCIDVQNLRIASDFCAKSIEETILLVKH